MRIPKGVSWRSTSAPALSTVVTSRYRLGVSTDHSAGLGTVSACSTARRSQGPRVAGAAASVATAFPAGSRIVETRRKDRSASLSFSSSVDTATAAAARRLEATNVPQWPTWR